jgi:hypothetical protein
MRRRTRTRIVETLAAAALVAALVTPLAAASPTGGKRIEVPKSLRGLQEPGSTGYVPPTISYREPGSTGYLPPTTRTAIAVMTKASSPAKLVDPLAVSWLRGHGYSASQVAVMTGSVAPWLTPAEREYVVGIGALTPTQIAAAFGSGSGTSGTNGPRVSLDRPKVDPLAVSYLRGRGLSPSEIADWTAGMCSHEVKPASCFAVFDRVSAPKETAVSGGFDWTDAGIGAGATLGLLLLAIGLAFTLVIIQRRHTGRLGHA